ncbi:MAG: 1-acyl-sn-glycerol-3-phosphate acyltransferase [Planctomycetales bacterium]|nr:1-acyl-sn-glycerol-3-phosphate acyltransferase [Planctomycetales bacterium]
MNRQPYGTPPQWWPPRLTPWWIRATRGWRRNMLRRKQRIVEVDFHGVDILRREIDAGHGVLITPNHAVHYDSAALYLAADQVDLPLYFMVAWQVFSMSSTFECWFMQRIGCFSVNREATDRQAMKQAIHILQNEPYPLVIFPEGDVYHTTDEVTPFREGAAALALSAAKRSKREIVAVPCGIKFWYLEDVRSSILETLELLEERLFQRTHPELREQDRIHRLAEAIIALKELDYLGYTNQGRVRQRTGQLVETILQHIEQRHATPISRRGDIPNRVKALRQSVIAKLEANIELPDVDIPPDEQRRLVRDMEDLFFVMQLYSYRGDYLDGQPSLERVAETLDKLEEDILERDLPTVRGRRRAEVRFGTPIPIASGESRTSVADLTMQLQQAVQAQMDAINACRH